MSDAPATLETDPAARKQAALERQLALLEQLAEAGLRLALTIEGEAAQAAAAGQPVRDDAAMAFSRVARAVRLTAMLQSRLLEEPQARGPSGAGPDEAAEGSLDAIVSPDDLYVPIEVRRRRQVQGVVRGVAEEAALDGETVERLVAEAGERMKRDDIYGLVRNRPYGELVAFICGELGLDPDWARLAKEAWEEAEDAGKSARQVARIAMAPADGRRTERSRQGRLAWAAGRYAPAFHGSS